MIEHTYKFIIEGDEYQILEYFLPDYSVGIMGEAGWYVIPADFPNDRIAPDELTLFVTCEDFRVYSFTGNDFTGETGLTAERIYYP